jgi:surface polysaccharide O-acyltransferase-like enzyme
MVTYLCVNNFWTWIFKMWWMCKVCIQVRTGLQPLITKSPKFHYKCWVYAGKILFLLWTIINGECPCEQISVQWICIVQWNCGNVHQHQKLYCLHEKEVVHCRMGVSYFLIVLSSFFRPDNIWKIPGKQKTDEQKVGRREFNVNAWIPS